MQTYRINLLLPRARERRVRVQTTVMAIIYSFALIERENCSFGAMIKSCVNIFTPLSDTKQRFAEFELEKS